ncbi:Eukaryotic translation initiation factor 3 subunit D, partial [Coemansia sp. RSA 2704]
SYNPSDFVSQLGLNEFNAWGILKALIDLCLRLDEGKYVIMRDPNKPLIQLYRVPPNSFEDNDSDNDDDNEKPDPAANA